MANRIKIIRLPEIKNRGGNLNKLWYVEFYVRNPYTDKMERFRKFKGINKLKTFRGRTRAAEKLQQYWIDKIKSGWLPPDPKEMYLFEGD